ncbi:MAG: Tol-Pal system beta propeller repeat protein TolB [Pseudomonadota bacterium]|nr:Tol-Pal system beta propeller repeat protein TolB [Pseudomonadota bacterium]
MPLTPDLDSSLQASRPRRRFLASVAGVCGTVALPALAQFKVEIAGVGATQIPLALAPFRGDAAGGTAAVWQIIGADLERSGQVRVLPTTEALDERSSVDLTQWKGRGADALLAGSVNRLADGRTDLRVKLWDTVKSAELIGQSRVVPAADLRLGAHRIADEVLEKLTGERGVNATRIAFVTKEGRRYTLRITDADGEGGQVAVASNESIISPAWSADGRKLAYVSFESQKAVVWSQDLSTGERRVVADFRGSNSAPAWSPDGQRMAVALARGGLTQIYSVAAAGAGTGSATEPRRLTNSGSIDTEPVYSADGSRIYFVSDRGGGPQIYRMAATGGGVERVSFEGGYNISPSVSADGKYVAYITRQGNSFKLALQDLQSGGVQLLTDTNDDESPSFAPNSRQLVYATRQQGRNVLMTTTIDGRIKARLLTSSADVREPAWGPFGR